MLDLHRLRILHTLSVCGTISATATTLGYTPSAISQQLATLERSTGVALLHRTARSATLTDAGWLLAAHAADLLAAAERAEADLATVAQAVGGRRVIGTLASVAIEIARIAIKLQRQHPNLRLVVRQLDSPHAPEAVSQQLCDIALIDEWVSPPGAAATAPPAGLTRHALSSEPLVLAVPVGHPITHHERPDLHRDLPELLHTLPWLCAPDGHPSRTAGDSILDYYRTRPARRWCFEGLDTIAALVSDDAGAAMLPSSVAATQPTTRLAMIPLHGGARRLHAITRTGATEPTTAACLTAIADGLAATTALSH